MKLSARARYAARLLLDLAPSDEGSPVRATTLSANTGISVQFIEQIIRPLKKAGLIDSVRGASGGYYLKANPQEITLGQVVRIMEGGISLADCCADPETCGRSQDCKTRSVWARASRALEEELDSIPLTELLDESDTLND